ncbi:MAG: NAD-dependent epimerase/dehydratase family protein [Gemmatimonadota bacterium]|nr:NAD-dependent epimerase/dehydratase family protein [Gemmatimonadota bacterium]
MRILLFGATGMIGSGVLLECLDHPDVTEVISMSRRTCGVVHDKLTERITQDYLDYSAVQDAFAGIDACFFCLGVSAVGMSEDAYRTVTFDIPTAAAGTLWSESPDATFIYISGSGADSTGRGRVMWARVKGQIENHLIARAPDRAFMFRPGYIQPMRGVKSRTRWYQAMYSVTGFAYPLLRHLDRWVTSTVAVGQAMIRVAREGSEAHPDPIIETKDINRIASG